MNYWKKGLELTRHRLYLIYLENLYVHEYNTDDVQMRKYTCVFYIQILNYSVIYLRYTLGSERM